MTSEEDLSCGGLCRLITENFNKKIFEKNMFLYWFCAYIYDFKGIWGKKMVKFFTRKGPPYDFRVKNQPSPNQKFFSKIKMYGNIMQNAAFKSAEI